MLAQPLGGGDVGTRRRKGDERGVGKTQEEGEERRERRWICHVQGTGGVGGALFHGAGAADWAGGAEAARGFDAIRCGHRAQGAAGTVAGEVDDFHTGADVDLQHGGAGGKPYKRGMPDSFAVYLVQANLWCILPFSAASHKKSVSLQFTPEKAWHKYEAYLEPWHLLRQ